MSKEYVVAACQKENLNVELIGGVIMMFYEPENKDAQLQKFKETLSKLKYQSSYGYCMVRKKSNNSSII